MIAQAYLADVERGNKRLFLRRRGDRRRGAAGAVADRLPDRPARRAAAEVDAADLTIVAALGPLLAAHGIALAGLDVIAGRLIEVNVTCPGGMHKTDALLGTDLSGATMRRLLIHRTPPRRSPRMNSTVAIVCIALLGILLFLLGANVTRHRAIRGATGNQTPTDPADRHVHRRRGPTATPPSTCRRSSCCCSSASRSATAGGWTSSRRGRRARSLHALGMLTSKTVASHGPVRQTLGPCRSCLPRSDAVARDGAADAARQLAARVPRARRPPSTTRSTTALYDELVELEAAIPSS